MTKVSIDSFGLHVAGNGEDAETVFEHAQTICKALILLGAKPALDITIRTDDGRAAKEEAAAVIETITNAWWGDDALHAFSRGDEAEPEAEPEPVPLIDAIEPAIEQEVEPIAQEVVQDEPAHSPVKATVVAPAAPEVKPNPVPKTVPQKPAPVIVASVESDDEDAPTPLRLDWSGSPYAAEVRKLANGTLFRMLPKPTRYGMINHFGFALAKHLKAAPTQRQWDKYRLAWLPTANNMSVSYVTGPGGWSTISKKWLDSAGAA